MTDQQEINVPGYTWFGNNRKQIAKRALRESGGVGILIRVGVLDKFDVAVISDKIEGILWVARTIEVINKNCRQGIGICSCYLPPIGSSRGDHVSRILCGIA